MFPELVTPTTKASVVTLDNCHIECGDINLENATVQFVQDDNFTLEIILTDDQLTFSDQMNAVFNNDSAHLYSARLSESLELFTTGGSETGMRLIPAKRPIMIVTENDVVRMKALLVNGPDLNNFTVTRDVATISYERAHAKMGSQSPPIAVTGSVEILFDAPQATKTACKYLDGFVRFLTLLKGSRTGSGSVYGYSVSGETTFLRIGFTGFDEAKTPNGWFFQTLTKNVPELYSSYTDYVSSHTRPLLKTIEYYRAANVIKDSSLEMAVIASHGALELMVHHILEVHGGWSKTHTSKRDIKFADKSRAAFKLIRCAADPLEHSPKLQAFAKAKSDLDAFDIVSLFRNKLTHNDPKFSYEGMELYEVWSVSQWLCEMFVFYCLGYLGEATDRRRYGDWSVGPEKLKFEY